MIDLFAGPGGLGEGFASLRQPGDPGLYAFRTAISIEKEVSAHRTLELRHFYREFAPDAVPDDYYRYLAGEISREELYSRHPEQAHRAEQTAWLCTLGVNGTHDTVRTRIGQALGGHRKWVLVGGPPCQAYSRAGRSRMRGNPDFDDDPRHFLYKEYLRILADHRPPVFVMENVKGLISSRVKGRYVINDILHDLNNPGAAVKGESAGLEYRLYSLSRPGAMSLDADPGAFIVRAEDYGIPQARHRIFIVGIRSDIDIEPRTLEKSDQRPTVRDVIGDLPGIRSHLSGTPDSDELWAQAVAEINRQPWFIHGRENGNAELVARAEEALDALKEQRLSDKAPARYLTAPAALDGWFHDDRLPVLLSHEARSHMPSDLHRYLFAAVYAQVKQVTPKLRNFPEELLPKHKNVQAGRTGYVFADRFRVQVADLPATTITSHISKDGHYYIHYDPAQCRSLTVREAARLQTFPDNYKFEGNRTQQYQQVGNAVPPRLANQIAQVVYEILEGIH